MKTLTTFFLLLFAYCADAQRIIYHEEFDEMPSYYIDGWGYEFTGVVPFQAGIPFWVGPCMQPEGAAMSENGGPNKVACFCECHGIDHNDSNVLAISPSINLSADTGVWLKYDSYYIGYESGGITERATVEVSTDNGATWTVIETVAPSVPIGRFNTHYIRLTGYDLMPNVKIGFRYSDMGGFQMNGWAFDNVTVFTPAHNDIALLSATPADTLLGYVTLGTGYAHKGVIFNNGLDTIHSFQYHIQQDGGSVKTNTITGVNIPMFGTFNFNNPWPDTVLTPGKHHIKVWATLDGDTAHKNDSVDVSLYGASFIPSKKLTIESGEGTYNGWSPRNIYYLSTVPTLDVPACLISVHENDPMVDTTYHDFMFHLGWNYVPYILFDRRTKVPLDSFFIYLDAQKRYFGFADVTLSTVVAGNTVGVTVGVTPAIDMQGDFRLALVLTEDNVYGTTPDWAQYNNYAGGAYGPMGGYETMPNPIPAGAVHYKNVARIASPTPDGLPGMLPSVLTAGNTYYHTIYANILPEWDLNQLHAKVLLIRHDDSTILNANEGAFPLGVRNVNQALGSASLYPNPADQTTALYFEMPSQLSATISITDMSGRSVYQVLSTVYNQGHNQLQLPVSLLPNGVYIVTLNTEQGTKSLKLNVLH